MATKSTSSNDETIKTKKIDLQVLKYERQSSRLHSELLNKNLNEYTKMYQDTMAVNCDLKVELLAEDRAMKQDPTYNESSAKELHAIHREGNIYAKKLQYQQKKAAKLDLLIVELKVKLDQLKNVAISGKQAVLQEAQMNSRIRKLEKALDRRMIELNRKIADNAKLKDKIDHCHLERETMDAVYANIEADMLWNEKKVKDLQMQVDQEMERRLKLEHQILRIKENAQKEDGMFNTKHHESMKALQSEAAKDAFANIIKKPQQMISNLEQIQDSAKQLVKTKFFKHDKSKNLWKSIKGKVELDLADTNFQHHRDSLEKMHEVSGTTTVEQLVEAFVNQEKDHFARVEHVNQLAADMEDCRNNCTSLREKIVKLKSNQSAGEIQKQNRAEELREQIEKNQQACKNISKNTQALQQKIEKISPLVEALHDRTGCSIVASNDDVAAGTLLTWLRQIETRVVDVVAKYCHEENENARGIGRFDLMQNIPTPRVMDENAPFKYEGIKPPTLHVESNDATEDEYPLTYSELQHKIKAAEE